MAGKSTATKKKAAPKAPATKKANVTPEVAVDTHAHPSDAKYIKVALVLAALTAVEIGLYYIAEDIPGSVNAGALLALMVVKFIAVGGYFMHLKFDSRVLRRLFISGLVLGSIVYTIMLQTFYDFIG